MANTNDDVIIVGSLSDKEMRKAIDDLVGYVGDQTTLMAGKFTKSIDMMRDAMKDFAVTQKVSVDLMKQAWREMSSSFDAMVAAQSQSTGGGSGSRGGGGSAAPDTVKELKEAIAAAEQVRDTLKRWSPQLERANKQIEEMRNRLNTMLAKGTLKQQMADARKELGDAMTLPSKTLADAQNKLARLIDVQNHYKNTTVLSVQQTNRLATAIQNVKEKIDRLKQTKPQKLSDILGMDENSFDAISKKMSALKKLAWSDDNEKNTIIANYQRLREEQNKLLSSNAKMARSNNYLAQSFGYIRNRIVYALTLGAITNFTKQIYEIRGQYELLERSLGVLVNSFEQGSRIFQELNAMAIESPFTLMELAGAAKQLTAYNFAANEVVDTTRRLADISAALGVPMERLTYNLGQIRAQTVLNARDARDFANAGLPIVKSLSEYYTELEGKVVSTGEVYDRMSKKMVSYTDVMAVLNKMTDEGGKFFEFQAKQAETLRVQMANLTLAWNNMLNEIGEANQEGLISLTTPVKVLKAMLQNWESLNRVLKNVILSYGLLKVAQMIAIRQQWALAASTGNTARMMGFLGNAINRVVASFSALFANPWTWIFVGVFAFVDLIGKMRATRAEITKLNEEIAEGAGEASQANLDFLNNKGNKATREAAKEGKLAAEQAAKAWDSIESHLHTSASAANSLLGELWQIEDVNERVAKGFDYVESIQKAQAALQDLQSDTIMVTQDKGWWGILGEGLVSDLKDYAEALHDFEGDYKELQDLLYTDKGTNTYIKIHFKEFEKELNETAESINNFIQAHNIKDPLQINEILSRVKAQIKTQNPEIKGELATLFDISLDKRMAELTNGAVDKNASLWAMFMERLKHNSSATFQGITDDIYKQSSKLSDDQQAAVDENLEYFKNTMPSYYNAAKSMVEDASQLKIHIGIAFNVQALTDFQKQVRDRISNASGVLDFGSDAMLPTQNDNLQSWVKTQQGAIKTLREQNKLYAKDSSQWAKDQIAANDKEIQQRKNLLDLFNQSYVAEKKGRGKTDKDIVAEALKQELSIIKEIQSNYDKLRKAGLSDTEAINMATKGYELTLERVNNVLSKFGINKFNASDFAGKNVNQLLETLQKQRTALLASGKVKTSSLQALDVEIQKLTVDAKTYDMKKVTDGLNNELGKLKDEYELAVELDANPEFAGAFMELFDIDPNELPHSIDKYAEKIVAALNKSLRERKNNLQLPTIDLTTDDIKAFEEMTKKGGLDEKSFEEIKKAWEDIRNLRKKDAEDTIKLTRDLQYKLADTNGKIAIEEEKLAVLQRKLAKETNEDKKRLLELQIQDQRNAIAKLKEEVLQMLPTYKNLFNSIVEHSVVVTQRIAKQWKNALENAVKNPDGTYTITDPKTGQQATITRKEYGNQIDKANGKLRETQSSFAKIKEAFTKGEDKEVDFAKGLELVAGEAKKAADGLHTIADIVSQLGGEDADEAVEVLNDIASTMEGLATAGVGVAQIQSGDIIGGTVNVIKGTWQAVSTWFDNSNKKIDKKIKESGRNVKQLEIAYAELEKQIEKSMGTAETEARRAAIENKKLQLTELENQLALEKSRKKKNQDKDAILELEGQISSLRMEIQDLNDDIANNLLGSDVKSAAEQFVDSWVSAWREGKTTLKAMQSEMNDIMENLVKKALANKIVGTLLEPLYKEVDRMTSAGSAGDEALTIEEAHELAKQAGIVTKEINKALGEFYGQLNSLGIVRKITDLSSLQQGIQSVSETTAESLEAYMNGVSQQVYYQSDIMTQIRDTILGFELDVQVATLGQMLLQLQQSYQVQQSIESLLQGVLNPSGRAFNVELIS